MARAIFSRVFGIQSLGQDEIDLQRATLPLTADGIREFEIELRSVERAISRIERVINPASSTASLSALSALSQVSSVPARTSGRSENRA